MLLVRSVSGPAQVKGGSKITYIATSFNMSDPPKSELKKINWLVKAGSKTIKRAKNIGQIFEFKIPKDLVGKEIIIMPYRRTATQVVSVISNIVEELDTSPRSNKIIFLTRDQWKANSKYPRRGTIVDPIVRTKVFIHHTVIIDDDNTINEWETIEEVKKQMKVLQTIRKNDLGADVPYSIVAFCMANGDLVLGEGRGVNRSGAHTSGHNTKALGISFQGNFEKPSLPKHFHSQLVMLGKWLRNLREKEGFVNLGNERPWGREVFAHSDVKPTACPGEYIHKSLDKIRYL